MSRAAFIAEYQQSSIVAIAKAQAAGVAQAQIDLYVFAARRINGAWF
jgi:hypothetical protein